MAFFHLFVLEFRLFVWRVSLCHLFAWRYFVFSQGVISSFRVAFFRFFAWRYFGAKRRKTKWLKPATIVTCSSLVCARWLFLHVLRPTKNYLCFRFPDPTDVFGPIVNIIVLKEEEKKKKKREEKIKKLRCGHKTYGSILSLRTVSFSVFRSTNYGTSRTQISRFSSQGFFWLVRSIFWRQAKTFVTEAGYVINQFVYNKCFWQIVSTNKMLASFFWRWNFLNKFENSL